MISQKNYDRGNSLNGINTWNRLHDHIYIYWQIGKLDDKGIETLIIEAMPVFAWAEDNALNV